MHVFDYFVGTLGDVETKRTRMAVIIFGISDYQSQLCYNTALDSLVFDKKFGENYNPQKYVYINFYNPIIMTLIICIDCHEFNTK